MERVKPEEEDSQSQTTTPKRATMRPKGSADALAEPSCFMQGQVVWAERNFPSTTRMTLWPAIVTSPAASPSKTKGGAKKPNGSSVLVRWVGADEAAESVNVSADKLKVFDSADANAKRSRAAAFKAAVEEATYLAAQGVSGGAARGAKRKSTQIDARVKVEVKADVSMELEDVKDVKEGRKKRARREKTSAPAAAAAEDTPQHIKAEVNADFGGEEEEEEEISEYEKLRQANMNRNKQILAALELPSMPAAAHGDAAMVAVKARGLKGAKKSPRDVAPERERSLRVQGKAPDGKNLELPAGKKSQKSASNKLTEFASSLLKVSGRLA